MQPGCAGVAGAEKLSFGLCAVQGYLRLKAVCVSRLSAEVEGLAEPESHLGSHVVELGCGRTGDTLEEVVGSGNEDEARGWGHGFRGTGEIGGGAELVVVPAEEEFRSGAGLEELVGVVAAGGADGKAETNASDDARISATGTQADVGAEREAGEEDRPMEVSGHPAERGSDVVLFAVTSVKEAFAEANAAEVEANDRQAEGQEGLHGVVDDLGVHGSAGGRVGVADQGGEGGVGLAGVEESFEFAGGAGEVVDGL